MSNLPALATVDTFIDQVICCEAETLARSLPDNSINAVICSPPYYGLRSYLPADHTDKGREIGLEDTPEQYVARLVALFREVRRVLRDDGVVFCNLGDSYATHNSGGKGYAHNFRKPEVAEREGVSQAKPSATQMGLKEKDLIGIPWRVAFALQADGWYLRSEITWCKTAPMPEPVTDRPTTATEKVFMFTKSPRYFYDNEAVRVKSSGASGGGFSSAYAQNQPAHGAMRLNRPADNGTRNLWNYWLISPEPSPLHHFAMFPQALVEPCVLAGCPEGGIVFDPFMGSGTVALVAMRLGRHFVGTDINREYVEMARTRLRYRGDDRRMVREQEAGVEQIALFDGVGT